ncbi:hypothetical protein [Pelobium manganitolerans]
MAGESSFGFSTGSFSSFTGDLATGFLGALFLTTGASSKQGLS